MIHDSVRPEGAVPSVRPSDGEPTFVGPGLVDPALVDPGPVGPAPVGPAPVDPAWVASPSRSRAWRGTVSFQALGCKANQEEMECLVSRLVEAGYGVVPFGQPADWVFVNTCTVTWAADSDSRQTVRRAVRSKQPGGRVVATGCLAQRDPLALARIEGVDWVVGNGEKPGLAHWIEQDAWPEGDPGPAREAGSEGFGSCTQVLVGPDPTLTGFAEFGMATDGRRTRASLKIQDGCDEHCTFCVIPQVRGRSRSRPFGDCLEQARTLVGAGYAEIALTGINTALWGRDLEPAADLADLLRGLITVPGLARLRLNSLEPQYVTTAWLDLLASDPRFCRHLHLPLQSGDDGILRRMNRRYDRARYAEVVQAAFARLPDAAIGADVMVGFPGETDTQFARTYELLASLPLAYLHVFRYSPRPDTASPRLGAALETAEGKRRSEALRQLDRELRAAHAERAVGTWQTVIPEAPVEGGWQGLSGNYLRVRFAWDGVEAPGRVPRPVLVTRALADGGVEGGGGDGRPRRRRAVPCGRRRSRTPRRSRGGVGMKRAYIETYGCQMNVADSALMANLLTEAGFALTEDVHEASLVLLNTCAIRERAEERVTARIGQLRQLKRVRPDLVLGITGCMPKHLGKDLLDRLPAVDLFLGPDSYRQLPQLVAEAALRPTLELRLDDENYADLDPVSIEGIHAFVPIMRGCDRFCTFCVVPLTRGREKSLPLADVVRQVEGAVERGVRAVTLLGQTVNSYHHEGDRFVDLLDRISRIPELKRIRFTSPHPVAFGEEVFALMAERKNLCAHLHLPVQSGSDRILESMKRGHTREEYLQLVATIRRHLPEVGLTTDLIVGYPGETEEDFAATLDLVQTVRFDSAFMFRYSPRSGTHAYRKLRDEELPDAVSGERLERLIRAQEAISLERYQRWEGRFVEVLVEGPSRRDARNSVGKSDDGKTVILPGTPPAGALVSVEVARATSHTLLAQGVFQPPALGLTESVEPIEV